MSAGANILSNASSAMALEKNTKKHRVSGRLWKKKNYF
jgi:hypothetical protein